MDKYPTCPIVNDEQHFDVSLPKGEYSSYPMYIHREVFFRIFVIDEVDGMIDVRSEIGKSEARGLFR